MGGDGKNRFPATSNRAQIGRGPGLPGQQGTGPSWQALGPGPAQSPPTWQPSTGWQGSELSPGTPPAAALPAPRPGRHRLGGRVPAAIVAAVVLIGAGAGSSLVLASSPGGAASPAGAVQALFTAAGNSDVIGALDALAPGERDAIEPGLQDVVSQLQRLGVLSSAADLNHVAGVSLQFDNVQTTTDYLANDVAAVSVTSGSVTSTIDPNSLPLGAFIKDLAGAALAGQAQTSSSPASTGSSVFGTVEIAGRWYVSIGYSIAINALRSSSGTGAPPPAGQAVQAAGAPTAEGAVQDIFSSISNLDLEGLVADLAPDEMAALDAYAPAWLAQAQSAIDSLQGRVSIQFGNLGMSTEPLGDGTLVKVDNLAFDIKYGGDEVNYSNGCYTYVSAGQTKTVCPSQNASQSEAQLLSVLPPALKPIYQRFVSSRPDIGFVTVEENGSWFVSPTRTYLQVIVAVLSEFQPGDLQTLVANGPALARAFEELFGQEMQNAGAGMPGTLPTG